VVSIVGAAPLVGERTLVRIEKVARSAAQASLVNPPPGVVSGPDASGDSAAAEEGDARPRRRGRRGGRGRPKKAESPSS